MKDKIRNKRDQIKRFLLIKPTNHGYHGILPSTYLTTAHTSG